MVSWGVGNARCPFLCSVWSVSACAAQRITHSTSVDDDTPYNTKDVTFAAKLAAVPTRSHVKKTNTQSQSHSMAFTRII